MLIQANCPSCKIRSEFQLPIGTKEKTCGNCKTNQIAFSTDIFLLDETLNQCPCCGGAHLYRQKDFNRTIGIFLIIMGVLLAYFTYGLSLIVVTLIDWSLSRLVGDVGICYKCLAQFRSSSAIGRLDPFNLVLFDYYKNLAPMISINSTSTNT